MSARNQQSEWSLFLQTVYKYFSRPMESLAFFFYFIFIVFMIGGLSIWISVYHGDCEGILSNAATYIIAITATSTVDFFLYEHEDVNAEIKKAFNILSIAIIVIAILLGFIILDKNISFGTRYWLAMVGIPFCLSVWWFSNSKNLTIMNSISIEDITQENSPIKGNLDEFKTE